MKDIEELAIELAQQMNGVVSEDTQHPDIQIALYYIKEAVNNALCNLRKEVLNKGLKDSPSSMPGVVGYNQALFEVSKLIEDSLNSK